MIVAIIPARGGSRGIPKKNIVPFLGKPLIAWTIDAAYKSKYIKEILVSTDDEDIMDEAWAYGLEVIERPAEISGAFAQSEDAIIHALKTMNIKPEIAVMLQVTSPIRGENDIDRCIDMVLNGGFDSALTGVRAHKFIWRDYENGAWALNYDPVNGMRPMRQSLEREFFENGSVYAFRTEILLETGKRLGGRIGICEVNYWTQFEIDTQEDLALCEWIMENVEL